MTNSQTEKSRLLPSSSSVSLYGIDVNEDFSKESIQHVSIEFLTTMAAIGGFLFGYDTGVVSGALILIDEEFDLTDFQCEVVVAATVFGAILTALTSGTLMNAIMR